MNEMFYSLVFDMKLQRIIALALLLFLSVSLFAQTDTLRMAYWVQGRVSDAESGKAIESAYVSIAGRNTATVTNADGRFILKSEDEISRIQISYLGYRTENTTVISGQTLDIRLRPAPLTLEGATIISGNALEIVRAAIDKIPDNYSSKPELLECFYRETLRKRSRYTYISEAVARMYKTGYGQGVWSDRTALDKSRVLLSQRRGDTLSVKVQGGPAQASYLDVVKNPDMLFGRETIMLYLFEMDVPVYIDGRLQFVIKFMPSSSLTERALYYGTIYIDSERLSFTRIEMSMDMSDVNKAIHQIVVKKPFGLRLVPKELSIVVNYDLDGDINRMSYFRSTIRFNCDWKKRLFATSYTAVNELVVTDLRKEAVPIPKSEVFRTSDILSDKAYEFTDPDFWKDYNIIEPSASLEHAVDRLRKRH